MKENKYAAGAALCPECSSVIEYLYTTCPWCNHKFTGKESLKILSMLAESGVEQSDLIGELRDAGKEFCSSMLPFISENFEKGGQGAKLASLLVCQEFGDPSELKPALLEEGYKISSNVVKIGIIKTLTMAGTPDAVTVLKRLESYENDPEVLRTFSTQIAGDADRGTQVDEISLITLSADDIEVEGAKKPPPPPPQKIQSIDTETVSSSPHLKEEELPKAQEILPPLPEIPETHHLPSDVSLPAITEKKQIERRTPAKLSGIIFAGVGFLITGFSVLIVLLLLGIKIPIGKNLSYEGKSEKQKNHQIHKKGEGTVNKAIDIQKQEEIREEKGAESESLKKQKIVKKEDLPKPAEENLPGKLKFSITASSYHKDFPPENMIDGNPKTVWQEEKGERPLNHKIVLSFEKEVTLTALSFITGYDDPEGPRGDMFKLNNRLKKAVVKFSDQSERELSFEDTREKQTIKLDPPVKTQTAEITVLEVYRGSWFYDNAIAEIEAEGY